MYRFKGFIESADITGPDESIGHIRPPDSGIASDFLNLPV